MRWLPGHAIRYRGSVCWPDGVTMVSRDQLLLVVAHRVAFEMDCYDVRAPKGFIRDVPLRASDFEIVGFLR